MGVLDRFKREKPLTAAAVTVVEPEQMARGMVQTRESGEAWAIYRTLGEVRYATNQQARLIGRLDWTITLNGGDPLETEQSDELMRAAFGDNVDQLAERASLMLQVPGGYYLARTKPNDPDSWRVFSAPLSAKDKKKVEKSDAVVQVRTEDPADSDRNDSPVLGAMDTCRELILARAQSRAQSRSRTAQHGLLLYPSEGVKDPVTFEANLQNVITAPLADERSTASVTPNLVGFPAEFIEKWRKLDLAGDYDEKLDEKIERLVRSVAVQLDSPIELVEGFGDSNHWSAWAVQEDNWTGHVEPMAKPIGQGFAAAIMKVTGATGLKIEPDPGPLMVRRPSVEVALAANEAGLVSDDWTREQLGADETDAPEVAQEDPAVAKALEMVVAAPSLAQDPGLDVLVGQIRSILTGAPMPAFPDPAPVPEAPAASEPRAIAAALRGRMPQVAAVEHSIDSRALAAIDTQAHDSVEDLLTDTADRVLERLGAKVRTMARSGGLPEGVTNAELAVRYEGEIPNAEVAISETIAASLPKLDRVVGRAFSRLRSAGVDLTLDPDDAESARSLYSVLLADVVAARLAAKPADALTWQAARRVVAVAGGNSDPAPMMVAS